jgi:hypothetical protein
MARRKIAPIPLEIVTDCPGTALLPAAAFGSLMRLVVHFWQSECRPLPQSGDRLFVLACAHRPTWTNHKAEIMRIFNESASALERAFNENKRKRILLSTLRERGHAVRRLNKLKKAMAVPAVIEAPAPRRDQAAKRSGKGFTEKIAA